MIIKGIECSKCHDIIFSRARYDFHYCSCGKIAVDGGFDYLKVCGEGWTPVSIKTRLTPTHFYKDWASGKDKYGIIKYEPTKYRKHK